MNVLRELIISRWIDSDKNGFILIFIGITKFIRGHGNTENR